MIDKTSCLAGFLGLALMSCGHGHDGDHPHEGHETSGVEDAGHADAESDGEDHAEEPGDEHGDEHPHPHASPDPHAEVPLGSVTIGELDVLLAQGHGAVEAGHEGHLVVKLPYTDQGATVVRAWIGTDDRTLSFVGKGTYSETSDDYDVHAVAPTPLPAEPWWWIEIEPPVGEKQVGFARPILH